MQISPISFRVQSFQARQPQQSQQPQPIVDIEGKRDDEVVMYSTWGGNYAFPITAGQLKRAQEVDKPSIDKNINQEVTYSTWGGNYAYPVTTEQTEYQQPVKNIIEEHEKPHIDNICEYNKINRHPLEGCDETPEEYYRRKINSPEWGAY
ncbi:MAG: hypothetical protein IJ003_00320 [Candidatus Gastranaerophilales bacterium]|nr:hypothetical protein [Candidatus Gastranaerophilales bacterium]